MIKPLYNVVRSRAPLRLGLAGGGTDIKEYYSIYGGYVLNATINMYAHCTLEIETEEIIFHASDLETTIKFDLDDQVTFDHKLKLHAGIYDKIMKLYNKGKNIPLRISTYCDVPAGSGLGSSSTVVIAILKAFIEMFNLPLGEYDVARLAYEIERVDLGLAGGKQDQYAATFGGFNFMEFHKRENVIVNPLRIRNWFISELEESLVLYYTGQSRDSDEIIKEQVKNSISTDNNNLSSMHKIKKYSILMKEAILKGNIELLSKIISVSWEAKKRTASVVSNSHIDKVYNAAINSGAKSGKISGAGGGGFMFFIVDPSKRNEVIKVLESFGGRVFNTSFVNHGSKSWHL